MAALRVARRVRGEPHGEPSRDLLQQWRRISSRAHIIRRLQRGNSPGSPGSPCAPPHLPTATSLGAGCGRAPPSGRVPRRGGRGAICRKGGARAARAAAGRRLTAGAARCGRGAGAGARAACAVPARGATGHRGRGGTGGHAVKGTPREGGAGSPPRLAVPASRTGRQAGGAGACICAVVVAAGFEAYARRMRQGCGRDPHEVPGRAQRHRPRASQVSALLWGLVHHRCDLTGHLEALKSYFLLGRGDFYQQFLDEVRGSRPAGSCEGNRHGAEQQCALAQPEKPGRCLGPGWRQAPPRPRASCCVHCQRPPR
jgi:hypothetical protein